MLVRLLRAVVVVAVVAAAMLLPSLANAASRHRSAPSGQCDRTPDRCLARTWHERLTALKAANPDSNDALDDVDDWDLGADPMPRTSVDHGTAVPDPDSTPRWLRARRAADPRAASLIIWRKLAAPRPPPSL
jgi:hypothetical protein